MTISKTLQSICPECRERIEARIYKNKNRVYIEKECPKHGGFKDIYWSDSEHYERVEVFGQEGDGLQNPRTQTSLGCPFDCGICPRHKSYTLLAIVDVTNRCNLRCPVCFANAGVKGYVYEPSPEQIRAMLENLRNNQPLPAPALQFSGGEPTLRPDLPGLIGMAKGLGFQNIEVNTNGIRLAKSVDYCRALKEAGLDTIYLQFDGLTPEVYRYTRGRDLVGVKRKAVENCRRAGIDSIVLVVTLIKGVNDPQLGEIVRFAADNMDVVRCVNVQPVSFSGRRPGEDLSTRRITIPDFVKLIEAQTEGSIRASDFYPVSSVVPIARAVGALKGERYPEFTAHPHCGAATYFFVAEGKIVAINRYVDVEKFIRSLEGVYRVASKGYKAVSKIMLLASLRHVKFGLLRKYLWPLLKRGTFEALRDIHYKMVLISCMHFMDAYNFDVERAGRCVIHYASPDGRIIPFCTYNNLGYREEIEQKFKEPS